ncbi:Nardilysin [Carabus blaptoides fortunei]
MHSNTKVEVLNNPVTSENDKKEYKVIRLENGLVACLISDLTNPAAIVSSLDDDDESECEDYCSESELEMEESESCTEEGDSDENETIDRKKTVETEEKMAAASLSIDVGSFSDPETIPGMAHFLEHMVFMGSEKYPQENDFDNYLKKRGGSDNASTDCEATTFYFECLEKHLAKVLDKFVQFFISPLMKREAMTRERESIESEFQMSISSDVYRKIQILFHTTKHGPASKFLWGNLITLRDNVTDDVLYKAVHEFRKRHYSAHRMKLAIQARLPLDVLEAYVVNCFSSVPNNNLPKEDFSQYAEGVFDSPAFRRLYYIKPVKDLCQVDLTFALPSLLNMYKSKPHMYVSWLLDHEGKGSIMSYLREKLWALEIYSGNDESDMEHNTMYAIFTVTLILTPAGLEHISEVIEAVFSYISFLKELGPQERIFNEIKAIEDTAFRFKEEKSAVDFVEELSEAMLYYPSEDYITGGELFFEYNPEAISMVINKLNPDNVNIVILSSIVPDHITYDKIEPWFSTNYTDRDIPVEWIENWSQAKPMECFSLPEENKFLTTNFDILDLSNTVVPTYPEKIVDSKLIELWYKPDNKFKLPNAFMYYYFISPMVRESALNACMIDLFINLLGIQLTEEAYAATVAYLGYSITTSDYGLILKVSGYNQNLPLLLELIIKYMKQVPSASKEAMFSAVKDKQAKNYYNTFLKPSKLARAVRLSHLMNVYWPPLEKYHALKQVTFEMFKEFAQNFLKTFHIQGLIQGNISQEIALAANNNIVSILQCEPLSIDQLQQVRVVQLPVGKNHCKVMSFNEGDSNSIITNYYQYGPGTFKTLLTIEILLLMMEGPVFDILRTKEQLGYHVYCSLTDTYGILGYTITVNAQANKHSADHVDKRMEAFIKKMVHTFKRMSDKEINKVKQDLIKVKQLVDVHLKDEVSRNWTEIVQQEFIFDRLPKEIAMIEEINVSEIKKWLHTHSLDKKNVRILSIQIVGHKKDEETDTSNTANQTVTDSGTECKDYQIQFINENNFNNHKFITNTEEFKKDLHLFPVHKVTS